MCTNLEHFDTTASTPLCLCLHLGEELDWCHSSEFVCSLFTLGYGGISWSGQSDGYGFVLILKLSWTYSICYTVNVPFHFYSHFMKWCNLSTVHCTDNKWNACTTDASIGSERINELWRYKTLPKRIFVTHESQQKNVMYSSYKRQDILHYDCLGHRAPTIRRLLWEEGLSAGRRSIHKFLQKYRDMKSIQRRPGSEQLTKITTTIKEIV